MGQNCIAKVSAIQVEPMQINATEVTSMQIDLHPARRTIDAGGVGGGDGAEGDTNQE
jgi:hypothetical protein